ncbi:hypothetical protein L6164_016388 [Bauhinia variegata]|uniref:Uncharacterized protein n=1 Tax=Bauhinia variegata TaxID=167791 RepID=A0ACB9NRF5_BAUVA|nr:hypothetical protein L6164_016388 [Bauhinia variegata]
MAVLNLSKFMSCLGVLAICLSPATSRSVAPAIPKRNNGQEPEGKPRYWVYPGGGANSTPPAPKMHP